MPDPKNLDEILNQLENDNQIDEEKEEVEDISLDQLEEEDEEESEDEDDLDFDERWYPN